MIHVLDNLVVSLIYLFSAFIIFFVGKLLFDVLHRSFRLNHELVEKDNFALGIAMAGYYLGLTIAIGGSIVGPSRGLLEDMIDLLAFEPNGPKVTLMRQLEAIALTFRHVQG